MSQPFADMKTVRAALFDVIDAGCTCTPGEKHPWEIDDRPGEPDEAVNIQRSLFVDAVIARIAELQSIPGD